MAGIRLAAGVGLPDVLAREGVHPETPHVPYTPGWDLVGTVDQLGQGVTGFELRQTVAAMGLPDWMTSRPLIAG
jgi:NADPH2:quinone reductase